MSGVTVRPLTRADRQAWLAMRTTLYVEDAGDEPIGLDEDIDMMLADKAWGTFAAAAPDGTLVGLIELNERNYAEGCRTSPVAYIEGIWVAPGWRRRGVARQLVEAGMAWARSRGRSEIASDVQLANLVSQAVHTRLGFEETERLVTYRRDLPSAPAKAPGAPARKPAPSKAAPKEKGARKPRP